MDLKYSILNWVVTKTIPVTSCMKAVNVPSSKFLTTGGGKGQGIVFISENQ